MQSSGGDHGDGSGVEPGSPVGTEATSCSSEDDRGYQGAFEAVFAVGDIASNDET